MARLGKCLCRGRALRKRRRLHGQTLKLGLGVMGGISTSRTGGTSKGMQCAGNGSVQRAGQEWAWDPNKEDHTLCFSPAVEKEEPQGLFGFFF